MSKNKTEGNSAASEPEASWIIASDEKEMCVCQTENGEVAMLLTSPKSGARDAPILAWPTSEAAEVDLALMRARGSVDDSFKPCYVLRVK